MASSREEERKRGEQEEEWDVALPPVFRKEFVPLREADGGLVWYQLMQALTELPGKGADHRLLVLVGSLLVEGALDEVLAALTPGGSIEGLHFGKKTSIFKGLALAPTCFVEAIEITKSLRNDFVHQRGVAVFGDVERGRIDRVRALARRLNKKLRGKIEDCPPEQAFLKMVIELCVRLYVLRNHVALLNDYLRSDEFLGALQDFYHRSDWPYS